MSTEGEDVSWRGDGGEGVSAPALGAAGATVTPAPAGPDGDGACAGVTPPHEGDGDEVPPGWHADPAGRFAQRWWDGTAWTSSVSVGGLVLQDPAADARPDTSVVTARALVVQVADAPGAPLHPPELLPVWDRDRQVRVGWFHVDHGGLFRASTGFRVLDAVGRVVLHLQPQTHLRTYSFHVQDATGRAVGRLHRSGQLISLLGPAPDGTAAEVLWASTSRSAVQRWDDATSRWTTDRVLVDVSGAPAGTLRTEGPWWELERREEASATLPVLWAALVPYVLFMARKDAEAEAARRHHRIQEHHRHF
ncbi:DUF2510 domain-containing protein [Iamia majanohamensis]|uniref:DUF2510 domain-containing protein n=1 Tax=Iamia majanohamensis TaxID=467976 RepID=A0AAE9Y3I9_9ACTN|nr:DUF2510 domain-containing protein [Iamia majanohamensis]WCO65359.1 DUF2510 domain-containing protein [Iamia majanohamensis]